jgi:hypothetical protein
MFNVAGQIQTQGGLTMIVTIQGKKVDVNQITICAKCSDLCNAQLKDGEGRVVAEHDGYVPALMPDEHYGDYVMLDIDLETGMILNWVRPTKAVVEETKWKLEE